MRPLIVVCGALLLASLITIAAAAPVLYGGFSYNFTRTLLGTTDLSWNTSYLLRDGTLPMTGTLNLSGYNISNVLDPVAAQDAATKKYVDDVNASASANASAYAVAINASVNANLTAYITAVNESVNTNLTAYIVAVNATVGAAGDTSDFLFLNGSRNMSGSLNMSGNNISQVLDPVAAQDAATKKYVDDVNASASANASAYSEAINASVNTNITAYVTAVNATVSHGSTDMGWNASYYLRDTTRSLTGAGIFRDVNNAYLSLIGGIPTGNYSGSLQLYGGDNVAQSGGFIMSVGNESGGTLEVVFSALGRTDNPELSLNNNKIINLLDPTAAQDAATKAYVDLVNATANTNLTAYIVAVNATGGGSGSGDMTWNTSYLLTDGTRNMSGSLNMSGNNISNVLDPVAAQDATTKKYVDDVNASASANASAYSIAINASVNTNLTAYIVAVNESVNANLTAYIVAVNATGGGSVDTSWNTSYLLRDGTLPMTANLSMGGYNISNVLDPVAAQDAATKKYVDDVNASASANASAYAVAINESINTNLTAYVTAVNNSVNTNLTAYITAVNATNGGGSGNTSWNTSYLLRDGTLPMTGALNMSGNNISNVLDPVAAQDAATKKYVDDVNSSASANASAYAVAINASVNTNLTAYIVAVNESVNANLTKYITDVNATSGGSVDTSWNASYLLRDGTLPMTDNLNMSGHNISDVLNPVADQDAATKKYVDDVNASASTNASAYAVAINESVNTNLTKYITDVNATVAHGSTDTGWNLSYLLRDGSRNMTGSLNMSGHNISDVLDPVAAQDAATKKYVDDVNASASANASAYSTAINSSVNTNLTAYIVAVNESVNANLTAYIVAVNATAGGGSADMTWNESYLLTDGTRNMSGSLNMSGYNISDVLDPVAAQDAATKKYVDDVNASASANASAYAVAINGSVNTNLTAYVTAVNASVNTNLTAYVTAVNATVSHGSSDMGWNVSYLLLDGSRAMTGILNAGGFNVSNLLDPVAAQDAATKKYVDDVNASASANASAYSEAINASVNTNLTKYITDVNATVGINNSYVTLANGSYVQITNTSYAKNPSYSYISLMAGSAMVPLTSSANLSQNETPTNKVNYIYGEFIDGGSENLQWIAEMPADWNGGLITAQYFWTASSGAGTVKWNLSTLLFPDDAALDTALFDNSTASVIDTLISANNLHVSSESSPFTISSAGSGGTTLIAKLTRDSGGDTLSGSARIIAVRLKYIRTLA